MFDVNFYMKAGEYKKNISQGKVFTKIEISKLFSSIKADHPKIFNIETTNSCNMSCKMCPRVTLMTRKVEVMPLEVFTNIITQISPIDNETWAQWERFVQEFYGIFPDEMSENHFFLYIIPKVVVLHGFGDPLLDPYMLERIQILESMNIPSYFSCNPANIDIEKCLSFCEAGLDYIKFSIESVEDNVQQKIRGKESNFGGSYKKIIRLADLIAEKSCKTKIVITMINLKWNSDGESFKELQKAFHGRDVYLYLKSQDQEWYESSNIETKSIHWSEFCHYPWSSMTIACNGDVVACTSDFNNELLLGDTKKKTLYEIWNSMEYTQFRKEHIFGDARVIKCFKQCDMSLVGDCVYS